MPNGVAHNNEADAFRHTFMQAELTVLFSDKKAKGAGDNHEKKSTSLHETNMDLWNNQVGRQIGREVKAECERLGLNPHISEKDRKIVYDMIAQKVVEAMKSGKLITNPNDSRKFIPRYKLEKDGTLTGLAADITTEEKQDIINHYREEGLCNNMSDEELLEFDKRVKEAHLFDPENRVFYQNEYNPMLASKGSNNELRIIQI